MAHWEYKVITSGKGGFATPALMEKFLNDLGKDEWDILSFHTAPDNPLAFHGLARRSTQREWTLEDAAAAAAKAEADKLRAEFAAKFSGVQQGGSAEQPSTLATEETGKDDGLRRLRDTDRDNDPEALADEAAGLKGDDWDDMPEEDELPTFFEAVKPHLRRNQRGPGQSVAIDYLSKRWDQREADITGALVECGLTVPETDESPAEYFEFEGDLYWLNRNPRGQLFLNVREKPRPVFRTAQAKRLPDDDPAAQELTAEAAANKKSEQPPRKERERERERDREREAPKSEAPSKPADETPAKPGEPLPAGEALLEKIRPLMRRNRRGPGFSGTTGFLAKAFKQSETDLVAALAALGLTAPEKQGGKPEYVRIGAFEYWLNKDNRGGVWINGRERREGERAPAEEGGTAAAAEEGAPPAPVAAENVPPEEATLPAGEIAPAEPQVTLAPPAEAPSAGEPGSEAPVAAAAEAEAASEPSAAAEATPPPVVEGADPGLVALRGHLKPNRRGSGASGELGFVQRALEKSDEDFAALLAQAGLTIPATAEEKPVYVEYGEEIVWVNRNPKDGSLWLNAKPKPARKPSRPRTKKAE